jgi:hypothetical protein
LPLTVEEYLDAAHAEQKRLFPHVKWKLHDSPKFFGEHKNNLQRHCSLHYLTLYNEKYGVNKVNKHRV